MRVRGTIWAWQRKTNLSTVFIFFLKTEEKILSFFHSINIRENCYLFVLTVFSVITLDLGILSKYHLLKYNGLVQLGGQTLRTEITFIYKLYNIVHVKYKIRDYYVALINIIIIITNAYILINFFFINPHLTYLFYYYN